MPKRGAPKALKDNFKTDIVLSEPDQTWFKRRIKERGLLNKDVAEAFGVHPNKVWMMTSGEKGIRPHEILIWSRVLEVPLPIVWQKFGLPWPAPAVPLTGAVNADGRVRILETPRTAPAPDMAAEGLAALEVSHDQPALGWKRGTILYYRPSDRVDISAVGRLSVVGLGDQPAPIVGVLDAAALGKARVLVLGGAEVVESAEAISAAPVEWIRAG